jgi:hypothetical protein
LKPLRLRNASTWAIKCLLIVLVMAPSKAMRSYRVNKKRLEISYIEESRS